LGRNLGSYPTVRLQFVFESRSIVIQPTGIDIEGGKQAFAALIANGL